MKKLGMEYSGELVTYMKCINYYFNVFNIKIAGQAVNKVLSEEKFSSKISENIIKGIGS